MLKKTLLLLCVCLLLAGCARSAPEEALKTNFFAMDTFIDFTIYTRDEKLPEKARALIEDLESRLSTTREGSEIHTLNRTGSVRLSEDTAFLLDRALELGRDTGGALDVSIYPVVRAWGFTADHFRVPRPEELAELLKLVDAGRIDFDRDSRRVTLPRGMQVDLGAIAKGYTGDRVTGLLREAGVESALINLGGNVHALGSKPGGEPWTVGVQDPGSEGYLGLLNIEDEAVITSGGYERYFEDEEGNVYWHILDPKTGCPARSGLLSATVVGPEGARCDALSTSLFVMGPDKAVEYWQARQDFDMLLLTEDGRLLITENLSRRFLQTDTSGQYRPEVLKPR